MNSNLKIKITGKNPSLFLKEIIKNKINIYNLEQKEHELLITINNYDYSKIKEMKTTCKIQVIKRYGINYYKWWLKKYKLLLLSWLIGIGIILVLSNLVFQIEIIHPNQKIVKLVRNDLKKFGLQKYHWKINYKQKEKIKEKLLLKEKDQIEWIEIEEIGTKYIVKVEQRKQKKTKEECKERHIIASKNAVILEVSASEGEIVKRKNQYVEKGDVIISGFIYNKEEIVAKKCAQGEVYGETWYRVKVLVPKTVQIRKQLDQEKLGISLMIFQKNWNLKGDISHFEKTEYNIIEGRIIPIKVGFAKFQAVKIVTKTVLPKTIEKKALSLASQKLTRQGKKVLEKKVLKKQEKNSKIEVEVFIRVKENITDYLDISNVNIEEENQKRSD